MNFSRSIRVLAISIAISLGQSAAAAEDSGRFFAIQVVDEQTGRGVPMVELRTTSSVSYYTDSGGLVAFYEPGLMDKRVWFNIASHGYEMPPDGLGARGVALDVRSGGQATIKIRRTNIAERVYRLTGEGIYRDTVMLGRRPPIEQPLVNAQITGQDGTLNATYAGKLYWFFGDTTRLSNVLGNFSMTGALAGLPDTLDPDVGINLRYFVREDGFVRAIAKMPGEGAVWLYGVSVVPDERGRERMCAFFQRRKGLGELLENGFVRFNDQSQSFEKLSTTPLDPPIFPKGYPFRAEIGGRAYIYFTAPYPMVRVRADLKSYLDLTMYEGYTCLKPDSRYVKGKTELDRDTAGKLIWGWKRNTPPLDPRQQQELIAAGKMTRDSSPEHLQSAGGKPILLNNCSCCWNAYRKKYVMIAGESMGATMLGETWYSEAPRPEGPWHTAVKIITHAKKPNDAHDFYNPVQHPFLDREGGRLIYLEGSYVNTFSGNPHPTPYYEYNQIMYRLDLSDSRLAPAQQSQ